MLSSVAVAVDAEVAVWRWYLPLQALDPSVVVDAPVTVQAAVSFLLTVLFGGAVIYRYGRRIDGGVDAWMASPHVSVLYGLMAYGIVVFLVAYAYNQLSRFGVGTTVLTVLGAVLLGIVLLSLGGLGFVVVGTWVTKTAGVRDPWLGLVGVGAVSAVAWLLLPFALGALVWFGIAALGIGGPARQWVHQSAVEADSR